MNTTNANEYIKTSENGSIYFDPTCDDTDIEIDHSKDHFNSEEKEYFFEELHLVIKNGVNYFD